MKADYNFGIIGAGFAGLVAALRLKKSGRYSFVIFERAPDVGGTWRDNTYPGCACDIASPLYSIAGEPNPDWNWQYGKQPEILAYLKGVTEKNNLNKHIRYNTDVVEARFIAERGCWAVKDRLGNTTTVAVLLMGLGPLNRSHIPQFKGLALFRGKYFHSAHWPTDYSLKGKRVAVIGTGASAIQVIPSIAPEVAHLTVLQRTPAWITYRFDHKVSPFARYLYRHLPLLLKLQRNAIFWLNELIGLGFTGHKMMNKVLEQLSLLKLQTEVKDPETRKKLKPDYTIGCKRILRSDDYYPTFNRTNVSLVTEDIDCFTERGIMTADGKEHFLDAVVFCTGFVAADIDLYMKIIGLEGRELVQEWNEQGAEAYLGTTIAGYPNLAYLLGPNTGLGHNSVVHIMESQMQYMMQYIEQLESLGNGAYLDVFEEEQQAYNAWLQQQFRGTVWSSGCKSWYQNKKGKNTVLYPRLASTFRKETKVINPKAYRHVLQGVTEGKTSIVKL